MPDSYVPESTVSRRDLGELRDMGEGEDESSM